MSFELRRRCRNWGIWAWRALMADRPDGSCINSLYQMGPAGDPEGWGEIDGNVVRAPQPYETAGEVEVDDDDAESMDVLIAQLSRGHRAVLHRRYVLRTRGWSRADVDAAIAAIQAISDETRRVHAAMKR